MYSKTQLAFKYIQYLFTASNGKGHGTHSPFVYDFIEKILIDRTPYKAYETVELLRTQLKQEEELLEVEDFGAGSAYESVKTRSVSSIAARAAKPRKFGQLLFRIVQYYKPNHIIELGTSLGITTSYLALANPDGLIHTLEGAELIAKKAEEDIKLLGIENVRIIKGNFDVTLQRVLAMMPVVDMAFIDGNHRKEPTLRYFEALLQKRSETSIFIFDDIHWSKEMEEAWEEIKKHEGVMLTVDLFFVGIVFFSPAFKVKQDFTVRF